MILKFFNTGKGNVKNATQYLMSIEKHGNPEVVRGSIKLTEKICNGIDRKWKYTSGVINFGSNDKLNSAELDEIMKSFEDVIFPGLTEHERNIVWVKHTEKQKTELHFLIPNTNVVTGQSFTPYLSKLDKNRMDTWKNIINLQYNLENPLEPSRRNLTNNVSKFDNKITRDKKTIDNQIQELIKAGILLSRDDIIKFLEDSGITVARKGKDYISIRWENENNKITKLRLKGEIYNENFRSIRNIRETQKRDAIKAGADSTGSSGQVISELRAKLEREILKARERNDKKFKSSRAKINKLDEVDGEYGVGGTNDKIEHEQLSIEDESNRQMVYETSRDIIRTDSRDNHNVNYNVFIEGAENYWNRGAGISGWNNGKSLDYEKTNNRQRIILNVSSDGNPLEGSTPQKPKTRAKYNWGVVSVDYSELLNISNWNNNLVLPNYKRVAGLSGAVYLNGVRSKNNIIGICPLLILDIDNENKNEKIISTDECIRLLKNKNLEGYVYETASSTPELNKYRLLIPFLSNKIIKFAKGNIDNISAWYKKFSIKIAEYIGINNQVDETSYRISQMYFPPLDNSKWFYNAGNRLDHKIFAQNATKELIDEIKKQKETIELIEKERQNQQKIQEEELKKYYNESDNNLKTNEFFNKPGDENRWKKVNTIGINNFVRIKRLVDLLYVPKLDENGMHKIYIDNKDPTYGYEVAGKVKYFTNSNFAWFFKSGKNKCVTEVVQEYLEENNKPHSIFNVAYWLTENMEKLLIPNRSYIYSYNYKFIRNIIDKISDISYCLEDFIEKLKNQLNLNFARLERHEIYLDWEKIKLNDIWFKDWNDIKFNSSMGKTIRYEGNSLKITNDIDM